MDETLKRKFIFDAQDFKEVEERMPSFVQYVKEKCRKDDLLFQVTALLIILVYGLVYLLKFELIQYLGMIYGLIGSALLVKGFFKSYKKIVLLSVARVGYSQPLASEYIYDRLYVGVGIIFVIISLITPIITYT